MHVQNVREVPEYEIDPSELDFSNSIDITKVMCFAFSSLSFATLGFEVGEHKSFTRRS